MRIVLFMILFPLLLWSVDFDHFRAMVLQKSPKIDAMKLSAKAIEQKAQIIRLYPSPSVELTSSRFDPYEEEVSNGWSVSYAQPIRLFSLEENLARQSHLTKKVSEARFKQNLARFLARLEYHYIDYVYAYKRTLLAQEERRIAHELKRIVYKRFRKGGASQAEVERISIEEHQAQEREYHWRQRLEEAFFKLLSFSGIDRKPTLERTFLYHFEKNDVSTPLNAPEITTAKAQTTLLEVKTKSENLALKRLRLYGSYEKEPDQQIARLGIGLNLPLYGTYREKAKLLRIKAKERKQETIALLHTLQFKKEALIRTLSHIRIRHRTLLVLLKDEKRLLHRYETGYRLSKGSLLDLITTKNSLIQTRKKLLDLALEFNRAMIKRHYLEGVYHD